MALEKPVIREHRQWPPSEDPHLEISCWQPLVPFAPVKPSRLSTV